MMMHDIIQCLYNNTNTLLDILSVSSSEDSGFFEGVFICKDEDVASFVDGIQSKTHHVSKTNVLPLL